MKIVLGTKKGITFSKELGENEQMVFLGRKIGDEIDGNLLGLSGYVLVITGGSDNTGAPMKKGVKGSHAVNALLTPGIGFKGKKGERVRKRVRGEVIGEDIVQVNCLVKQDGSQPLDELMPKQEKKEEVKK